jgi:hypothetical protein
MIFWHFFLSESNLVEPFERKILDGSFLHNVTCNVDFTVKGIKN